MEAPLEVLVMNTLNGQELCRVSFTSQKSYGDWGATKNGDRAEIHLGQLTGFLGTKNGTEKYLILLL